MSGINIGNAPIPRETKTNDRRADIILKFKHEKMYCEEAIPSAIFEMCGKDIDTLTKILRSPGLDIEVLVGGRNGIKVFRLNDYEWYAAESLEDAIAEACSNNGLSPDEAADESARVLTEEELDTFLLYEDDDDGSKYATASFRERLREMIREKTEFPCFFAGTEG